MASKIGIVIEREYTTRVMKKSFILMTLFAPLFFILLSALPGLLVAFGGEDEQVVAVIDHTGLYGEVLQSNDLYTFVIADQPLEHYSQAGEEAEVSGVLEIRQDLREDPKALSLYSFRTLPSGIEDYINRQLSDYTTKQKLLASGGQGIEEIIAESQNKVSAATYKLDEEGASQEVSSTFAEVFGMVLAFAIYMFVSIYGGVVLQSVMEEKKSRIMEVMVSSVRPFDLMMGKIIGVGLVGLTQIIIWVLLLVIFSQVGLFFLGDWAAANTASGATDALTTADLNEFTGFLGNINFLEIGIFFVLYFIGGFFLYASIYAGLGSSISSDEDAQTVMWPITVLMMVAFYVGFACMKSPESTLATIASYVPFTSPVVMMVRIPYGVALWELLLSVAVLYASFVLMVYLSARIYRVGILLYGKKPSLLEIGRWMLKG
ncbi:MAG: ABC transporter permease [Porphyromonas sp.]|nr:ABC transporter permease [Porphyromonas sp.]